MNNEELLQLGIQAAKRGQKDGARMPLRQVLQRDPRNETAMIWLARIARTTKERRQWLEACLEVNPENEVAQKGLEKLTYNKAATENRTLFIYGGIAVAMIVVFLVILIIAFAA